VGCGWGRELLLHLSKVFKNWGSIPSQVTLIFFEFVHVAFVLESQATIVKFFSLSDRIEILICISLMHIRHVLKFETHIYLTGKGIFKKINV
jgi:hypothetical protein